MAYLGAQSNTRFPGPIRTHNPNDLSIGSAVFAQMTADFLYAPSPPQNCIFTWGGDLDPI